MPINLPDLPNGLKQINTGITPGDGQGDPVRVMADKVNLNAQITLTENDDIAGDGLSWDSATRKLTFDGAPNQIIVGDSYVPLGSEFEIINGYLKVLALDGSKLSGTINPENVALLTNEVMVGSGGVGQAYTLSDEFEVSGGALSIAGIDWSKIENPSVTAEDLSLGNLGIPVGTVGGSGTEVTLGPDFVVSNGVLSLVASNQLVTLGSINATGAAVGRVLAIQGPANAMSLEWIDAEVGGGSVGDGSVSVGDFATINDPSPLAQIQTTADGASLEWVPDLRNRVEAGLRAYINFLNDQQRRVNLDYARSIAENQNRTVEVFNYKMPSSYTANIGQAQKAVELPGAGYIAGGSGIEGFNIFIERLDFMTETTKVVASIPGSDAVAGEKYTGMNRTKMNPVSAASPSDMYIAGFGSESPINYASWLWHIEKFNFEKQACSVLGTELDGNKPHAGVAVGDYRETYFVGGVDGNSTTNQTHLDVIVNLTFLEDAATTAGITLSGGDSVVRACAEPYYSNGATATVGFIFGGISATQSFSTIRKLTMLGVPTLVNSSTTLSTNRYSTGSFNDGAHAYIFGGATVKNTDALNSARKFTFATEAAGVLGVDLLAKRFGMVGCSSDRKGYLVGGKESVAHSTITQTYTENIPIWSERVMPELRTVANTTKHLPLYRYNG